MSSSTTLLDGTEVKVSHERGFRTESFSLSGDPHLQAIVDAVAYDYHELTGRPEVDDNTINALAATRQKVTVATASRGQFGAGSIRAMEGTVFAGNRGVGILPKGKRTNGFLLKDVLDFELGYNKIGVLQDRVNEVRAHFPVTEKLTQEHLDALPSRSSTCSLAVFGTVRMPDGPSSAGIWLLSEYQPEDDIVDGVLLIRPEDGTSEHGSIFGRQLLNVGGKITNFGGCTFREAVELTDMDYTAARAAVMAKIAVTA